MTSLGNQIILSPTPDQNTYPTGDFIVKCDAPSGAAKDVKPGSEVTVKGLLTSSLPENAWLTSCQVVSVTPGSTGTGPADPTGGASASTDNSQTGPNLSDKGVLLLSIPNAYSPHSLTLTAISPDTGESEVVRSFRAPSDCWLLYGVGNVVRGIIDSAPTYAVRQHFDDGYNKVEAHCKSDVHLLIDWK